MPTPLPAAPSPGEALNAALLAFVNAFPSEARLREHLAGCADARTAEAIGREMQAVVRRADDYLWAQEGGVTWDSAAQVRFDAHLLGAHEWLSGEALERMRGYAGWLCWHEGLFRDPA